MNGISLKRSWLCVSIPFVLLAFLNFRIWIHDVYPKTDSTPFLFATGLNIYTGDPLKVWHLPGYFWSEVSALFVAITGPQISNLKMFNILGVSFQWIVAGVSILWTGLLASKLKLNGLELLTFSSIFVFMPAALAYSGFWGHNFPASVLLMPISMTLFIGLIDKKLSYRYWFAALFLLAVVSVNFYIGLAIPACLVITILFFKSEKLLTDRVKKYFKLVFIVNVCFSALALWYVRENLAAYFGDDRKWWMLVSLLWIGWALLELIVWKYERAVTFFMFPLWLGFLLGVNQFVPYWFYSFLQAGKGSGGAQHLSEGSGNWLTALLDTFHYSWTWLILIVPVTLVALICQKKIIQHFHLLFFSLLALSLTIVFIYKPWALAIAEGHSGFWGISPYRYALFLPLIIGVLFLLLRQIVNRRQRKVLISFVLFSTTWGLCGYSLNFQEYLLHSEKVYQEVESEFTSILKEPENIIIINRVLGVPWGEVSYAYNSYRTKASFNKLFSKEWEKHRIYYSDCTTDQLIQRSEEIFKKSTYVVTDFLIKDEAFEEVYYDEMTQIRIHSIDNTIN